MHQEVVVLLTPLILTTIATDISSLNTGEETELPPTKEVPFYYHHQPTNKHQFYPVIQHVHVPYKVYEEQEVYFLHRYPVIRRVPVPVAVPIEVPVMKKVAVPIPVPIIKLTPFYYPIKVPKPFPIVKEIPIPVKVPVKVFKPYPVEKIIKYPVRSFIKRPVPYRVEQPVEIPHEKIVPVPIENPVPYPVKVEVPNPIPYPVEKEEPDAVEVPVDIPVPNEKSIPYPVENHENYPEEESVQLNEGNKEESYEENHVDYHDGERSSEYGRKIPRSDSRKANGQYFDSEQSFLESIQSERISKSNEKDKELKEVLKNITDENQASNNKKLLHFKNENKTEEDQGIKSDDYNKVEQIELKSFHESESTDKDDSLIKEVDKEENSDVKNIQKISKGKIVGKDF